MGLAPLIVVLKTLALRNHDDTYNRAARFWARIFGVNFLFGIVTGIAMEFQFGHELVATVSIRPAVLDNYKQHAVGFVIAVVVLGSLAVMMHGILKRADKMAFLASAAYLVGMLVGAAFALYPVVLPASTDPARSLTIYNTAAGHHGLTVGFTCWILGMILVLGYFVFLFRMFKGKARLEGEGY